MMGGPAQQIPVEGAAAPIVCPDGQMRVALTLRAGMQVTLMLEPDQVEPFMASWSAQAVNAAVEARRSQTGLIVPGNGSLPASLMRGLSHIAANGHGGL
jgi:hypothetical protein